jgi:hypothetical protein
MSKNPDGIKDNKLTIRIDGPYFPFEKFLKAISTFNSILREIDKETSEDGNPTITWSIQSVNEGSLVLTAQGNPRVEGVNFDRAFEVIDCFAGGLDSLRKTSDRPSGFSSAAMKHVETFAKLVSPNDFAELDFFSDGWKFNKMGEVAANLIQEPIESYKFCGSIVGKMVSLNNEKQTRFGVRIVEQRKTVNCFLDDEELFKTALEAIESRQPTYIYGEIRQIWNGLKVNIKASEIKLLPEENPSSTDVLNRMRMLKGSSN